MTREALDAELTSATELLSRGQVDDALALMAHLEETVTVPRDQAEVWARYATVFAVLELAEEMQGAIHRALMLDPTNARATYLSGVQAMAEQDWDGAVAALHKAASLYPQADRYHLAEVYGNLGYCHEMLGDPERAELYWEMCEELDPQGDAPAVADGPPPCSALERVETLLRQMGALGEKESLFGEPQDLPEDDPEDDGYWRIDDEDEAPAPARASAARPAAGKPAGGGRSGGRRRGR